MTLRSVCENMGTISMLTVEGDKQHSGPVTLHQLLHRYIVDKSAAVVIKIRNS